MILKTRNDNGRHRLVKQSFNIVLRWDWWLTPGCGRIYFPVFALREDRLPALRNAENIIIERLFLSSIFLPDESFGFRYRSVQRLEFNGFLSDLN